MSEFVASGSVPNNSYNQFFYKVFAEQDIRFFNYILVIDRWTNFDWKNGSVDYDDLFWIGDCRRTLKWNWIKRRISEMADTDVNKDHYLETDCDCLKIILWESPMHTSLTFVHNTITL